MDSGKGKEVREGYRYTEKHEWVKLSGEGEALCGITDYAQNSLGDIVFVEITPSLTGNDISKGDVIAVVESAKAASDVYCPVSGTVLESNSGIEDSPETLNSSPYDEGWFLRIRLSDMGELDSLMDAAQYRKYLESEG